MSEQTNESDDIVTALLRQAAEARIEAASAMVEALTDGDPEIWEPTPEKVAKWQAELDEAKAELADLTNADRT
ncbi:MAG: hypothetical protein EOS25_04935 [Mesorhizobium sp.]|uniref:hypothetical protein n=1 Tax=Mesorhizobium sp. TaxID=1871066 RepID=UPI000FE66493|nr:hypothetical protein [Mesorhizobium sp.]RWD50854.1 MAG: hypothetical protein EOS59_07605 [Mesorhizobium sp.]RWE58584.1 MAG: hypothetical protein EOS24_17675 [Mesorhizobium sp.]RWF09202.1 MAG: hypothetical protein EOS69_20475 [Mesorhizobium sp.]RWF21384.1 MAG: hypothetical protein EOS25_04935 [Mesorhizobium sp.]TIY05383.1 MAG: hypothetical protein E5V22_07630 [Mesorhizobium sp.]